MSRDELLDWEQRYRERGRLATAPARFVVEAIRRFSPSPGNALDVAGGTGRHAVWLAARGWNVTLVDVSPTALAIASDDASAEGVTLTTVQSDLDDLVLPSGPWDLAVVHHYLNRALFPVLADALAPGGLLVFAQPTVENRRRNDRPGPRHSLGLGEAAGLVVGLDVVFSFEGWTDDGRHEAQVVAQHRSNRGGTAPPGISAP